MALFEIFFPEFLPAERFFTGFRTFSSKVPLVIPMISAFFGDKIYFAAFLYRFLIYNIIILQLVKYYGIMRKNVINGDMSEIIFSPRAAENRLSIGFPGKIGHIADAKPRTYKATEFHPASTTRRLHPRYTKNGYLSDSRFPMVFASFTIKTADGFCSRERQSWNSKEKIFILPFSSPKSLKFS